jgi:hydroxymethylpyrimidine pyrophosphatase-like HAD family hydrolase/adenine/guanine phosphoribosyltransferase-like PRPP-binding protein
MLAAESEPEPESWAGLVSDFRALSSVPLPPRLLRWRMPIPEAFRCQDMSHHDVLAMAQRFVDSGASNGGRVLVVGPRTAGAYFAPLVSAHLQVHGIPSAGWITFRPRRGLSHDEKGRFRKMAAAASQVLVVDDHPNTGRTLVLTAALLERLGVAPQNIVILAPEHAAQPDWPQVVRQSAKLITLRWTEFHKQRLLNDPAAIASMLREFYREDGCDDVRVQPSPAVEAVNSRLQAHYPDGFQVRLKSVYEVRLSRPGRPPQVQHVCAKSVGWGWLGYHAYVAGKRLAGFVPAVLGLAGGLLFSEWVGGVEASAGEPRDRKTIVAMLPSYVAARVGRLRLTEDPSLRTESCRWTGRDTLLQLLRRPYGRFIGRLKASALRKQLDRYSNPLPSMVDGRMGPEDWVTRGSEVYKVDFEQHNFGGGEQDIADPAYDLAGAAYELALSEDEERQVLSAYVRETGDAAIQDRILLHKLLYGAVVMRSSAYRMARELSPEARDRWNRRYLSARNFLTFQMARHYGRELAGLGPPAWTERLFFLDLDGVFDWEFLPFPHTTPSGVRALRLLRSHGYSVVLNSGRSVEHVQNYCRAYGLPGGVAEFGSVFVDNVARLEIPLVDPGAQEQLLRCRERMANVLTDPGYRWSIRATPCLTARELEELLAGFDRLTFLRGQADCYILQKGLGKGAALEAVKAYLPAVQGPVVAIGDSTPDLEMLQRADLAYMPRNRNHTLRQLRGPKYHVTRRPLQRGLLEAAEHLAHDRAPRLRAGHLLDTLFR